MFQKMTAAKVTFVLGRQRKLARQIEQGAPYDLFLSAK